MPRGWSDKDERMYEWIRASELERGAGEERAEEIAARTVNKRRREEGRTPNERTQGTGNPSTPLDERSLDELHNLAEEAQIEGHAAMGKARLAAALHAAGRGPGHDGELEGRTVDELRGLARELEVRGRSGMRKGELIEAIRAARG